MEKVKKLGSGMVSTCYLLADGTVCKQYDIYWLKKGGRGSKEHLAKELSAFKIMGDLPFVSHLLRYDDTKKRLYMTYCGERVTKETLPEDWAKQCDEIGRALTKLGVYHNDIMCKNICVRDGRLHLVDFGLWSHRQHGSRISMIAAIKKELL
jgi:tRNA A-37 threonylcarbamoyl transferase component Bud32